MGTYALANKAAPSIIEQLCEISPDIFCNPTDMKTRIPGALASMYDDDELKHLIELAKNKLSVQVMLKFSPVIMRAWRQSAGMPVK